MKGPGSLDIVSQGLCALRGPCLSPCFSLSSFPCHPTGHFAAEDVKAKLHELNQKWESLKSKASQRRQDLEDSLQAQQYFADANEAESWMREKEPIVGSTDYGKDEDSAEVMHTGDTRLGLGTVRRTTTCARCSLMALKVFQHLFPLFSVVILLCLQNREGSLGLSLLAVTMSPFLFRFFCIHMYT